MTTEIRSAQPGDGSGCATAWMDAARYYVALDPERFVLPDADGLGEYFEALCAASAEPDRIGLVGLVDGQVVGLLRAGLHRPGPGARHHFIRRMREISLSVDLLVVAESVRRSGVASALMGAAHDWAVGLGAVVATTDTYGGSPLSVPFYEHRMGYARRGITFDRALP